MRTLPLALLAILTACSSASEKAAGDGSVPDMDAAVDMDSAAPEMDAAVVMDAATMDATADAGKDWCETSECGADEHCDFAANECVDVPANWADIVWTLNGVAHHGGEEGIECTLVYNATSPTKYVDLRIRTPETSHANMIKVVPAGNAWGATAGNGDKSNGMTTNVAITTTDTAFSASGLHMEFEGTAGTYAVDVSFHILKKTTVYFYFCNGIKVP